MVTCILPDHHTVVKSLLILIFKHIFIAFSPNKLMWSQLVFGFKIKYSVHSLRY